MKLLRKFLIPTIASVVFAGSSLAAQSSPIQLDQIVVTATKSGTAIKDVPGSVTIITDKEIQGQNMPNGDVGDLLRSIPGITLRRVRV